MPKRHPVIPIALALVMLLGAAGAASAQICQTPADAVKLPALTDKAGGGPPYPQHVSDEIVVRLYLHVVNGSPASDVWTYDEVDTALATLRAYYRPHGIRFLEVGRATDTINTFDQHGNAVDVFHDGGTAFEFDDWMSPNRLDIFFLSKTQDPIGCENQYMMNGMSFGIPASGLWVRGVDSIDSFILSHEVGHALGLKHTHDGYQFGDCLTSGDEVCDTRPSLDMRILCGSITPDCEFVPTQEMIDADPDILRFTNPPVTNIMSYSDPECMDEFTAGQVDRILWIAENEDTSGQMLSPPVVSSQSATAGTDGINPHVWTFTWYTRHKGVPAADRVVVSLGAGARTACLASPNVLRPTSTGASHSVTEVGSGLFKHVLAVPRATCVPNCDLNFRVYSTVNGEEYSGGVGSFRVKRCIGGKSMAGRDELPGFDIVATPNPFNPRTTVKLSITEDAPVTVAVFDVRGNRVARLHQGGLTAGRHEFNWDGTTDTGQRVASGVYYVRADVAGQTLNHRVALLK